MPHAHSMLFAWRRAQTCCGDAEKRQKPGKPYTTLLRSTAQKPKMRLRFHLSTRLLFVPWARRLRWCAFIESAVPVANGRNIISVNTGRRRLYTVEITEHTLLMRGLPAVAEGLCIVHISDIHAGFGKLDAVLDE